MYAVAAALTYSHGDSERWRRALEAEAALIMADVPPPASSAGSFTGLLGGSGQQHPHPHPHQHRFTATMDIDAMAWAPRRRAAREQVYGITPVSSGRRAGSSLSRSRGSSSAQLLGATASPQAGGDGTPPGGDGG